MILVHLKEAEFHRSSAWVFVDDSPHFTANLGDDSQLFFEFAPHGIARLLAFLDFAAGEFPFQRHGLMPRSLAGENPVIFQDQRGNDSFHG